MPARRAVPQNVASLLAPLPPDLRGLVLRARALVLATLPKATETVDSKARLIGYGYGPGYRGTVVTLILSQKGVKLGLVRGASLPDRWGLLAGSGKVHRHIAFAAAREFGRPGVRALLRATLTAWRAREAAQAGRESGRQARSAARENIDHPRSFEPH